MINIMYNVISKETEDMFTTVNTITQLFEKQDYSCMLPSFLLILNFERHITMRKEETQGVK